MTRSKHTKAGSYSRTDTTGAGGNLEYMHLHVRALYTWNANGRMSGCNQFTGGDIPRFHLVRTDAGCLWVFRHDLPNSVIEGLRSYAEREPFASSLHAPPVYREKYLELLAEHEPVEAVWHGPTYRFADVARNQNTHDDTRIVSIDASNTQLLQPHMDDWIVDAGQRHPFLAVLQDGYAVAICASVRITADAHEAGVETVPEYRRRGYARKVVAAWARAVAVTGAEPLYSTSWENGASQAVAKSLGLKLVGTDFHVR